MVHLPSAREPKAAEDSYQSCPFWLVLGGRAWLPKEVPTAQRDLRAGLPALPPGHEGWLLTPGEKKGQVAIRNLPSSLQMTTSMLWQPLLMPLLALLCFLVVPVLPGHTTCNPSEHGQSVRSGSVLLGAV